jgi:undecaprenyl-diphosphatase
MTIFQSFILGLVQGLTEFLPISSSAHLVFFQHVLGFSEPLLFYDVVLHLGTLVALFIYFAADIAHVLRDSIYGIFFIFRRKP